MNNNYNIENKQIIKYYKVDWSNPDVIKKYSNHKYSSHRQELLWKKYIE